MGPTPGDRAAPIIATQAPDRKHLIFVDWGPRCADAAENSYLQRQFQDEKSCLSICSSVVMEQRIKSHQTESGGVSNLFETLEDQIEHEYEFDFGIVMSAESNLSDMWVLVSHLPQEDRCRPWIKRLNT